MVGCVGQGQEWGSLSAGYRESLCDGAAGHATNRCPEVAIKRAIKAVENSLKEINYCGNECLFDEMGYMVTLFGPRVLWVMFRRGRSVNNVQQKGVGHSCMMS